MWMPTTSSHKQNVHRTARTTGPILRLQHVRPRCVKIVLFLRDTGARHDDVVEGTRANIETNAQKPVLVLPTGHALLEPFHSGHRDPK